MPVPSQSRLVKRGVSFFQGNVPAVAADQVVQDRDVKQLAGCDALAGDVDIFGGAGRVAGGMIMADNDA